MDYYIVDMHALSIIREIRSREDIRLLPADTPLEPTVRGQRFSLRRFEIPGLASMSGFDGQRRVMLMSPSGQRRFCSRVVRGTLCTSPLPAGSFYDLDIPAWLRDELGASARDGHHVAGPALCLVTIASNFQKLINQCRSTHAEALLRLASIAMELTGSFARHPIHPRDGDCAFMLTPLISVKDLRKELDKLRALHGALLAREAVALVAGGSASPMETLHYLALTLPARLGGLELPRPLLNEPMACTPHQRRLMDFPGLKPDLQWSGLKVAIEHEGHDWHDSGERHEADVRRIQDYQVCGWKVFPATAYDIRTPGRYRRYALKLCDAMDQAGMAGLFDQIGSLMGEPEFRVAQRLLFDTVGAPKEGCSDEGNGSLSGR